MKTRTTVRRPWIKLYPIDCLDGSIRYQLEPDERSVWYDLLNFSAICAKPGTIADKDGRAYPMSFIANRLNIPLDLLEKALKKCTEEGRIKDMEGVLSIVNWGAYQSEYQRQKPYREKKDVYAEAVRLTKEEYNKLVAQFSETGATERIENLSLYIQSKGDKYKSHYATLLSWEKRDRKGGQGGAYQRQPEENRKTTNDQRRASAQ